jgi:hypothetical protein
MKKPRKVGSSIAPQQDMPREEGIGRLPSDWPILTSRPPAFKQFALAKMECLRMKLDQRIAYGAYISLVEKDRYDTVIRLITTLRNVGRPNRPIYLCRLKNTCKPATARRWRNDRSYYGHGCSGCDVSSNAKHWRHTWRVENRSVSIP